MSIVCKFGYKPIVVIEIVAARPRYVQKTASGRGLRREPEIDFIAAPIRCNTEREHGEIRYIIVNINFDGFGLGSGIHPEDTGQNQR
jgi:hypothetical protein